MSDNNSANNMSDTSFTTPTNQGIGQVPMTPSPPPRSLVPPPAPKKQIRFNEQIRRIIEADKTVAQRIRLVQSMDIPDDMKKEIIEFLKEEEGLKKLQLRFAPPNEPGRGRTPSPHSSNSGHGQLGVVRGGKGKKVLVKKKGSKKSLKKSLKKNLKKKGGSKKKLTRGNKKP